MEDNFVIDDIESVLQSRENEEALLQRLSSYIIESRLRLTSSIDDFYNKWEESKNHRKSNAEVISQLHDQSKDIEKEMDEIILLQKVISKKISNAEKVENKLRDEIENEKRKKEELTLEMVDLQQALENKREAKKKEWYSIKKATAAFKDKLNIHVSFIEMDDHDCVTVTYFLYENPDKNNYYVQFLNYRNTTWKVQSTEPALKDEHLKKINLDFSKVYSIREITTFVYTIRKIFLKYYFT